MLLMSKYKCKHGYNPYSYSMGTTVNGLCNNIIGW